MAKGTIAGQKDRNSAYLKNPRGKDSRAIRLRHAGQGSSSVCRL